MHARALDSSWRRLALLLTLFFAACTQGQSSDLPPNHEVRAEVPPLADLPLPAPAPPASVRGEKLLATATSAYNTTRVRQRGTRRTLGFARERGGEFVQTILDLSDPDGPAHRYVTSMSAALVATAAAERLLVIGLGGGALIRVLHARLPRARIDAVEIDPEVIRLAAEWFGVVPTARLRVIAADGLRFIEDEGELYDLVWLDAFLLPTAPGTDASGVPEALQAEAFLRRLRARLRPGGVAAFNVHHTPTYRGRVDAIAAVFPHVAVAWPRGSTELVVLAGEAPLPPDLLRARARELTASGRWDDSLDTFIDALTPWNPTP